LFSIATVRDKEIFSWHDRTWISMDPISVENGQC